MASPYKLAALNLDIVATLMLAVALLSVHNKMKQETKIDAKVVRAMNIEAVFVYIGIAFFVIGFALLVVDEVLEDRA